MIYTDAITIKRTTQGTPDTNADGEPVPGTGTTTTTIYDGKASVQDGLSERQREKSGDASIDANAQVFLPKGQASIVTNVQPGDDVTTPIGSGTVQGWRHLDRRIYVKL